MKTDFHSIAKTPMLSKHLRFSAIGGFVYAINSIGQSFSALSASSLEYVSAISGSHSLSEAVLLFSLSLLRLICSEHLLHLLNFIVSGHEYPDFPEAC